MARASRGQPLLRGLLAAAGSDADGLDPVRGLPLQQLVELSQGQMSQSAIDGLVAQANGGVMPTEEASTEQWRERIDAGRFEGRTVVVTGAASGIGRAVAARVVREGGRVVAADLSAERLQELAESLPADRVVTVAGDISAQADVDAIVAAAEGRIDALANVAGINDDFSPLHETSDEMWERVLRVNLTGTFRLTRAVLPLMTAAGRGAIVNVASEAGLRGNASGTAYTTSKHAVIGMTRSAAFMYGPQGIRVNVVAPGGVATGIPFPRTCPSRARRGCAPSRPRSRRWPRPRSWPPRSRSCSPTTA